jgi:hypothetical protein
MKRMIAIVSLSLLPLLGHAESAGAAPIVATPSAAVAPAAEDSGSAWRTLAAGVGVVGGVIVADLFMGGALTASLFGWGTTAPAGPVVYSPEVLSARAAGAVLGEMITPATSIRDAAARRDMFYTLVLGLGGAVGAVATYWWAGSTMDTDVDASRAAGGG